MSQEKLKENPYARENLRFRKAYIRERLAILKSERDLLLSERDQLNDKLGIKKSVSEPQSEIAEQKKRSFIVNGTTFGGTQIGRSEGSEPGIFNLVSLPSRDSVSRRPENNGPGDTWLSGRPVLES